MVAIALSGLVWVHDILHRGWCALTYWFRLTTSFFGVKFILSRCSLIGDLISPVQPNLMSLEVSPSQVHHPTCNSDMSVNYLLKDLYHSIAILSTLYTIAALQAMLVQACTTSSWLYGVRQYHITQAMSERAVTRYFWSTHRLLEICAIHAMTAPMIIASKAIVILGEINRPSTYLVSIVCNQ